MTSTHRLERLKIAVLATDGFEEVELTEPKKALEEAGARVLVIAPKAGEIQGFNHTEKGLAVKVDATLDSVEAVTFDGVVLPGGVVNADALRMEPKARAFVKTLEQLHRPIAVICHGAWLLVSAGLVRNRTLTSWPSLQDDVRNSGGIWVDREVFIDANWLSSRKPDDIPAFNRALLRMLAERSRQETTERTSIIP